MRIETKLNIETYLATAERIANGYFAEDGSYAPHLGTVNTIAVFLDTCVKDSKWDGIENPDINEILMDDELIRLYADASDDYSFGLTYANAERDAMAIVDYKKGSISQIANLINGFVSEYFTPDNLAKIFGSSERFEEIVNGDPGKVTSLFTQATK